MHANDKNLENKAIKMFASTQIGDYWINNASGVMFFTERVIKLANGEPLLIAKAGYNLRLRELRLFELRGKEERTCPYCGDRGVDITNWQSSSVRYCPQHGAWIDIGDENCSGEEPLEIVNCHLVLNKHNAIVCSHGHTVSETTDIYFYPKVNAGYLIVAVNSSDCLPCWNAPYCQYAVFTVDQDTPGPDRTNDWLACIERL